MQGEYIEDNVVDAGGARGAYYYAERVWHTIAASTFDEDGTEHVNADAIGEREREKEWRFADKGNALEWGMTYDLDQDSIVPVPIADMPHRVNGWVIRVREPVTD